MARSHYLYFFVLIIPVDISSSLVTTVLSLEVKEIEDALSLCHLIVGPVRNIEGQKFIFIKTLAFRELIPFIYIYIALLTALPKNLPMMPATL
jgi:hypothetical protein